MVTSNQLNDVVNDDSGTGIKIRSRQQQSLPSNENFVRQNVASQGKAPRRLRLQCKLQVGPVNCRIKIGERSRCQSEEDMKSLITGVISLPIATKRI